MSDEAEPRIPNDFPPMLFKFPRRLSYEGRMNLESQIAVAMNERRMLAFDSDVNVYQLVGGRWRLIK